MKKALKIVIPVFIVVVLVVLLFPFRIQYRDGGTSVYRPISYAYKVCDYKMLAGGINTDKEYITGKRVEIFGIEIYRDANLNDDCIAAGIPVESLLDY